MKAFIVFLSAVPSLVLSGSVSSVRGFRSETDKLFESHARELAVEARALSVTLPPAMVATVPLTESAAPTLPPGAVKASSHVVQWGSARNGCSYALPSVTASCGAGGTIVLGQKSATVTGCITRNSNTLVCSSVASPTSNPQVTVTCFGTTAAQLTVSVQIPASQATCNDLLAVFPQSNLVIRGGAASVFALLGRYCKAANGAVLFNTNQTCGSGTKKTTQGSLSFCVADGSCNARLACNSSTPEKSCPGSCIDKLAAVTVSDQDPRGECVNAGPRPRPLPAGLHSITWSSFHPHCSSPASTITASCGTGGALAISNRAASVSQCTAIGASSVRCTKNATASSASIVFYCYGTTPTARTASAFLPKRNATNCNTAAANTINVASQVVILQRFCGNGTLTPRPSRACGKPSQLQITKPNNNPICVSSNQCKSTAKTSCSIALDDISVSDASPDPTCAVLGPKSLNF